MGQAKKRGSFDERKQQSIVRYATDRAERERQKAAWWASLTPAQQQQVEQGRARQQRAWAMMAGITARLGGGL
jgi:hypothetical protein